MSWFGIGCLGIKLLAAARNLLLTRFLTTELPTFLLTVNPTLDDRLPIIFISSLVCSRDCTIKLGATYLQRVLDTFKKSARFFIVLNNWFSFFRAKLKPPWKTSMLH